MDLHPQRFDVVCAVGAAREVRQVELDLVPALVQAHRHRANERLHAGGRLVVGRPESPPHVLIVKNLHLEGEVLFKIFYDHDEERQLDAQSLLGISRAGDVIRTDIGAHDLQNTRLDIRVGDSLHMSVAHCRIPNLEGLASDGIQNRQKARLKGVLEHGAGEMD